MANFTLAEAGDVFDSRDLIERIEELETELEEAREGNHFISPEAMDELATLRAFAEEAQGYIEDWHHGEQFIADSFFTEYAEQLAEDIGLTNSEASWPNNHIDWDAAAEELKIDYISFVLSGTTYWAR